MNRHEPVRVIHELLTNGAVLKTTIGPSDVHYETYDPSGRRIYDHREPITNSRNALGVRRMRARDQERAGYRL